MTSRALAILAFEILIFATVASSLKATVQLYQKETFEVSKESGLFKRHSRVKRDSTPERYVHCTGCLSFQKLFGNYSFTFKKNLLE